MHENCVRKCSNRIAAAVSYQPSVQRQWEQEVAEDLGTRPVHRQHRQLRQRTPTNETWDARPYNLHATQQFISSFNWTIRCVQTRVLLQTRNWKNDETEKRIYQTSQWFNMQITFVFLEPGSLRGLNVNAEFCHVVTSATCLSFKLVSQMLYCYLLKIPKIENVVTR